MTKIHCFVTGFGNVAGHAIYTACALTDQGKWIAGAVSLYADVAVTRVEEMAIKKAPAMLSDSFETVKHALADMSSGALADALRKALERMP